MINDALCFVTSGLRIDIPDASGITAAQLMIERASSHDPAIQPLILNCNLLGLNLPGLVHAHNQPPIQMQVPNSQNGAALFSGSAQAAQQSHSKTSRNCQPHGICKNVLSKTGVLESAPSLSEHTLLILQFSIFACLLNLHMI